MAHGRTTEQALAAAADHAPTSDKWAILNDLTEGREAFGLGDRPLAVLSALLSFHPKRDLSDGSLTVFPSNASLAARLHGMPESTLRRHLAALVAAGMIRRQDSPNGKRYVTRDGRGRIDHVFGFDLSPLLRRAAEIAEAATMARETARLTRRTRQTVILLIQEISSLLPLEEAETASWQDKLAELRLVLRRKLDLSALSGLEMSLRPMLSGLRSLAGETPEMGGNDAQNERHHHRTDSDQSGSEEAMNKEDDAIPTLPVVLQAAPDMADYAPGGIRNWRDLIRVADVVSPMMGITAETWRSARQALGERAASIALACMLQRFTQIRTPGAYLRRLSQTEGFRPATMVQALLRGKNGVSVCS